MIKKSCIIISLLTLILVSGNIHIGANPQPVPIFWMRVNNSVPVRTDYKCVYDHNSYIYFFGGQDSLGQMPNDVYKLRIDAPYSWIRNNAPGPEGRIGHALGHAIGSYNLILFGGINQAGQYLNDTWLYDSYNGIWRQVDSTGPSPRAYSSITYNRRTQGFVLFGGMNGDSLFGDTWEWYFTSGWHFKSVNGPSPRIDAGLVTPYQSYVQILYGGRAGFDGEVYNDIWEWWDTSWVQGQPLDSLWPTPRVNFAIGSYEGEIIIVGGQDAANTDSILNDSWWITYPWFPSVRARQWLVPELLQGRYGAYAVPGQSRAILLGGNKNTQNLHDVWLYPMYSYRPGDVNNNGKFNGMDLVYMVNFWKGTGPPPPCYVECWEGQMLYGPADADGSCSFDGLDITYLLNYLKGFGSAPAACSTCGL